MLGSLQNVSLYTQKHNSAELTEILRVYYPKIGATFGKTLMRNHQIRSRGGVSSLLGLKPDTPIRVRLSLDIGPKITRFKTSEIM